MMILEKILKKQLNEPAKAAASAMSTDLAASVREKLEAELREAHRALTKAGRYTDKSIHLRTLRSEEGSNDTLAAEVKVADMQTFFDRLGEIEKEIKAHEWGSNPKPALIADLTYLTIAGAEDFSYLESNVSVKLNQTQIGENIVFSFSGKNLMLDVQGGCYFSDLMRIQPRGNSEIVIKISNTPITSSMRIYSDFSNKPKLKIEAPGIYFEKELKIESRFDITSLNLSGAHFAEGITIDHCVFENAPDFLGAEFSKNVQFRRCFFKHPPNLHNATYKRNLIFENCNFGAANSIFKSQCDLKDIDAYRVLRMHYAKLRNGRMEGLFFSREQRGERMLGHSDPVDKFLSWCFDLLSDYGQSTSRIAAWFIVWNAAFTLLYTTFFQYDLTSKVEPFKYWLGLSFTLQNAFNPLALFSEKNIVSTQSILCFICALIQALGSIAVLTIFLLTIRTRFRRGGSSEN